MKTRGGVVNGSLAISCVGLVLSGCGDGGTPLGGEPIATDSADDDDGGSTGTIDPSGPTDPTVNPSDPTIDPTAADDTGSCGGCLDASGACQPGDVDDACGLLGEVCAPCEGGMVCDEGACVEPPACSPDDCDGCCDGDDCVAGTDVAACGRGGGQCGECPDGATCDSGVCDLPCEDSCGGCCEGDTCIELDDQDADGCGADGGACQGCSAGFECDGGECFSTACAASCDGCCDGDTCLDGTSDDECGAGGSTCDSCGVNQTCGDSGCEADPMAEWDVIAVDGMVAVVDENGDAWDSFNGLPDPYVTLEVVGMSGESAFDSDTEFPVWNETVLTAVTSTQLEAGLEASVVDSDLGFDTTMATCDIPADMLYNATTSWSCTIDDFEFWTITLTVQPTAG